MGAWIKPLILVVAVVVAWQIMVPALDVPKWLLPSPAQIALRMGEDYQLILLSTFKTLTIVLIAFGLAVTVGFACGVAFVESRVLRESVYPLLAVSQVVPHIAIAPLLVIWLGVGDAPKIAIAFLISFFPMVVGAFTGLTRIDEDMLHMIRGLGASRLQIMRLIRLPNSLPHVFAGMKVSVALAVIGAVVGEFVGAKHGLGYLALLGTAHGETDLTFASILVLAIMGIALFNAVGLAEKLLVSWHVER